LAGSSHGRSRKRGRRTKPASSGRAAAAPPAPTEPPPATAPPARGRSEERNAAVRATLSPLGPDERPWPIRIGALLALAIAVSNVVQVVVGGKVEFGKQHITPIGPLIFAVLMAACAVGMWQKRYWAVLGFQALLALAVLFFALLLVRASNALGFVVGVVGVFGPGYLFFKLVRVLSRIQMPTPPGTRSGGGR
jgi:hypothetical protein